MVNEQTYKKLIGELEIKKVALVAVSKTKSAAEIKQLYDLGQRDFGENYVQELVEKEKELPKDIRWHFIGHLQTNKAKLIVPFIHLVQSVDSLKLLKEINKQAEKNGRVIDCLLQVHIAEEETKFGLNEEELNLAMGQFVNSEMKNVRALGLMGMASLTDDMNKVRGEFKKLGTIYNTINAQYPMLNAPCSILSMGMTTDYRIAIEEGSNMVRIGSLIFGERS
jgi:pyridoxal phosphate enzyme (YggS family)